MEKNEGNKFYAVPLIGGILCNFAFFGNNIIIIPFLLSGLPPFSSLGFPILLLALAFGPVILDLVLGILMIVSAVKMKNRKTTLFEEKKKLLIFSWVVIGVSLGLSIFNLVLSRAFLFFHEPGLVGGLIIILGILFYKFVSKHNFIFGPPLVQEGEKIDPRPTKEQFLSIVHIFCTNCGFKYEKESIRFCPECGNRLVSK